MTTVGSKAFVEEYELVGWFDPYRWTLYSPLLRVVQVYRGDTS